MYKFPVGQTLFLFPSLLCPFVREVFSQKEIRTPQRAETVGCCNCSEMQSSGMQGHQETPQLPSTMELDKLLHLWHTNHPHLYHLPSATYIDEMLKDLVDNGENGFFTECQVSPLHFSAGFSALSRQSAGAKQVAGTWAAWLSTRRKLWKGLHTSCVKCSKHVDGNIKGIFELLSNIVLFSAVCLKDDSERSELLNQMMSFW